MIYSCLQLPWGMLDRARKSLPSQVELKQSKIPGAGLGVFATTFIPRYTWLAEFEGEVIIEYEHISDYAWTVSAYSITCLQMY